MKYFLSLLLFFTFLSVFSLAEELEGEVEKLEVIGSHIKRTSKGPSPVLVIDRDQIEMSGYNSVGDVLRDLPVASFGGQRESSLEDNTSVTKISLRGMESDDILILINGRRMSPIGGGNSVDLNILPISSIERIEILKDGASSLYGSDAIGGVINVVTKRNYVGGQVNIQGSLVQREDGNSLSGIASFMDFWNWDDDNDDNAWAGKGDKLSIDASYGGNKNDINYLIGGQVRFNAPLYLRDRKFGQPSIDHMSTSGSPGSWNDDGATWKADPNCPKERIKGGQCKFDYSPYMQFMPQIIQGSIFAQVDKEIGESTVMATAMYSLTRSFSILAPPPDWLVTPTQTEELNTDKDLRVPLEVAQRWGLSASGPIELKYRLVNEKGSGPRHTVSNVHYYQVQTSINTPVLDTMEFDGHLNISGSHYLNTGTAGWADRKMLMELAKKTPSAFNPFLPDDKKSDVTEAIYEPFTKTHANLLSIEPQLSGEMMNANDHTMSFAVGGLGAWQRYNQTSDEITQGNRQWGGGSRAEGEGSRWYSALYGELSLLSFEKVELQLAARTDYYSDFGFTEQEIPFTNELMPLSPRVALSFQPTDEVKLRASWSMGFKAPTLESIHLKTLTTYPFGLDTVRCEKPDPKIPGCAVGQFRTVLTGNKDLNPELSESFNAGIVLEPVKDVFFSIDYFRTSQQDIIVEASSSSAGDKLLGDVLAYEKKYGAEKLTEINASVSRDSNGQLKGIEISPSNQASYKAHGVDLEMGFSIPVENAWSLGVKVDHSHLLYVERQAFKKSDVETPVPYYEWIEDMFSLENPVSDLKTRTALYKFPRWRNRVVLSLMNTDMGHNFQLIVHNIPSQIKESGSEGEIDSYWQLDLAGMFSLNKNTSLTVGVKNILAAERPANDLDFGSSGYVASSLYSIRGRTIDARLTYNFQ